MCYTSLAGGQDVANDIQWFVSEGNIYSSY